MPEQIIKDNRENLKPESQDYLLEFVAFLKNYWLSILVVLLLGVALLLGWAFYNTHSQEQEAGASAMLALAQTPAQFEEIISQHPKSSAAPLALLSLASQQHATANIDQAEASYNRFLSEYPNHPWVGIAKMGLIQCQESRGSFDSAAAQYDALAREYPDDFLGPQALLGKARCLHALNRLADARAVYETIVVNSDSNSLWRRQADNLITLVDKDIRAEQRRRDTAAPMPPTPEPPEAPAAPPLPAPQAL